MTAVASAAGRRAFLRALGGLAATGSLATAASLVAQQPAGTPQPAPGAGMPGASMDGDGYIPVRRPAKARIDAVLGPQERDALERRLACPCPCSLDVFVCRTSMPCGFSPRMHADVVSLAEGGYTETEILGFFEEAYGEEVLNAPKPSGFNLVGWIAPFAAILAGGVFILLLLRRWRPAAAAAPDPSVRAIPVDATPDELARLQAAVREEEVR